MFPKSRSGAREVARLVLSFLEYPIMLLYAGSSTKYMGIPNIYLVSIRKANPVFGPAADMTINVGYFGMTAITSQNNTLSAVTIGRTGIHIATKFLGQLSTSSSLDDTTTALFTLASLLQSNIFLFFLAFPSMLFVISLLIFISIPRSRSSTSPSPRAIFRQHVLKKERRGICLVCCRAVSDYGCWDAPGAAALEFLSEAARGEVIIELGENLVILQWVVVLLEFVSAVACSVLCQVEAEEGAVLGESEGHGPVFLPVDKQDLEKQFVEF
ncbi:hypothetical protein G7Y89_g1543 [Cudoniella acicularis]|uniref:Uncharacterized protein n=1 Tax=Cudoniella acicularis TaxID=354080 RepID=A0A8H4RV26_9HELO|nr:hypothetical protein G7Y89_g1543 [Cudoniella acicularis]